MSTVYKSKKSRLTIGNRYLSRENPHEFISCQVNIVSAVAVAYHHIAEVAHVATHGQDLFSLRVTLQPTPPVSTINIVNLLDPTNKCLNSFVLILCNPSFIT